MATGNAGNWDGEVGGSSPVLTDNREGQIVPVADGAHSCSTVVAEKNIPLPLSPGKYQVRDQLKKEGKMPAGKYAGPELAFPSPLTGFTGKVSKLLHSPGRPVLHRYFSHSLKPRFFSPPRPSGGRAPELGSELASVEKTNAGPRC